jgi:hypothetical protein
MSTLSEAILDHELDEAMDKLTGESEDYGDDDYEDCDDDYEDCDDFDW